MNKIIKTIITISLSLMLFGCADKVPFKEQSTLDNSALVYVYAKVKTVNDDDSIAGEYSISVDSKRLDVRLVEGEYIPIDLKAPAKVNISATMGAIITKDITIDVRESNMYYIRAMVTEGSNFNFEQVSSEVGLSEIQNTVLSGSSVEDINEALAVDTTEEKGAAKAAHTGGNKIQKIKDAHQLKVDGIITQDEFEKLKAEILDAN